MKGFHLFKTGSLFFIFGWSFLFPYITLVIFAIAGKYVFNNEKLFLVLFPLLVPLSFFWFEILRWSNNENVIFISQNDGTTIPLAKKVLNYVISIWSLFWFTRIYGEILSKERFYFFFWHRLRLYVAVFPVYMKNPWWYPSLVFQLKWMILCYSYKIWV